MNFRMNFRIGNILGIAGLTAILASFMVFTYLSYAGYLGKNLTSTLVMFSNEFAWIVVLMFLLFLVMNTDTYRAVSNRTANRKDSVRFAAFAATLTCFASVTGTVYDPLIFDPSYIMLMTVALIGGPRIAMAITAVICVFVTVTTAPEYSKRVIYAVICLIITGAASCIIGRKGYPKLNTAMIMPVILGLSLGIASSVFLIGNPDALHYEGEFITSTVSQFFFCIMALLLFRLFKGIIENNDTLKKNKEDLNLAHDIQLTSLPHVFPVSHSMDIHAYMEPAIEVGGDFYDCFQTGRNLTVFTVGDVSDKGLPASLLMMRMMGSIKAAALSDNDPGRILTTVNRELCSNNSAEQFVTMWIGIYDSDTGILCYANAGHTPPYIRRKSGEFEKLPVKKGLMMGVNDMIRYKTDNIVMDDGDVLFVYTDGVNEAFNTEEEMFGQERLRSALNSSDMSSAESITESVKTDLSKFTEGRDRSDDITMMCVMIDRSWYNTLTVPGKAERLDEVNDFIMDVLSEAGCPVKDIMKMQIVSEEIFVNISDHAYVEREGNVTVYCGFHDSEIKLTFADDAPFFDPVSKDDIEIDSDVGSWPIGGFGIHMVKKLVTYVDYKYFNGKNIFTVWKKIGSQE